MPGVTLPAGTYTFKLADLTANRHVVQIFDKEEKKIFTTILAIPDQRLEPSDKPVVMFAERAAGVPPAVKAWFYPGETIGNEFVYPKSQAMAIAKATHEKVLSTSETSSDSGRMKRAGVGRVDESGQMATASSRSAAVGTAGDTAARKTRSELPRTASELPLFGLLSGLTIAAGLAVRRARRRLQDAA